MLASLIRRWGELVSVGRGPLRVLSLFPATAQLTTAAAILITDEPLRAHRFELCQVPRDTAVLDAANDARQQHLFVWVFIPLNPLFITRRTCYDDQQRLKRTCYFSWNNVVQRE